jgi:hypothetical protein
MKKILVIGLMLVMVLVAVPAFAGGFTIASSTVRVASGNFGPGASYQSAWNQSNAGVAIQTGVTYSGPWYNPTVTTFRNVFTNADSVGGSFGNGIDFQTGLAKAIVW